MNTLQSLLLSFGLLTAQYKSTTNILPDALGIKNNVPQAPAKLPTERLVQRNERPRDIHFYPGGRTAAQKPSTGIAPRSV